jgi:acetoacetate decarboxylase
MTARTTPPGEISGMPKLELRYPTTPQSIEALLPPGLTPTGEPQVHINIYCVPVQGEPEYGVSTKIPATFHGIDGYYCLGIGIDQESAIFISREINGQPKFPCSVTMFRLGSTITAKCVHQGHTFLELHGTVGEAEAVDPAPVETNEWWIKYSRAVGGAEGAYDFPPHVVRVRMVTAALERLPIDAEIQLRSSEWDPYLRHLPPTGPCTAALVTSQPREREITLAGALDPLEFWPFTDTIGGSRWPGTRGGPLAFADEPT